MKRYFEFAAKTGTLAMTLIVVLLLFFLAFPNLPITGELLDVKSGYTYDEAMSALQAYGADGRVTYLWVSLVLDTLFPLIYVTFFAGVIYRFKIFERTAWFSYIPVFGGVWDILENIQISTMLIQYPQITETQVAWASNFTFLKHWIGAVYLVVAALACLIAFVRMISTRFGSKKTIS